MFRGKTIIAFCLAVGISCGAAAFRFGDSAHAIGMLSTRGGKARHPFMITSGKDGYTLVMTGVVLPPFKGDVNIALEGSPAMNYSIYDSRPILDLGLRRRPKLERGTLTGVEAGDKLALWVVMRPESEKDLEALFDAGRKGLSRSADDAELQSDRGQTGDQALMLSFNAADSGQSLLHIPVVFTDLEAEGGSHGAHH